MGLDYSGADRAGYRSTNDDYDIGRDSSHIVKRSCLDSKASGTR